MVAQGEGEGEGEGEQKEGEVERGFCNCSHGAFLSDFVEKPMFSIWCMCNQLVEIRTCTSECVPSGYPKDLAPARAQRFKFLSRAMYIGQGNASMNRAPHDNAKWRAGDPRP